MFAFLANPIGKVVGAVGLCVLAFICLRIWLSTHDANVRSGYVLLAEKTAAEAKAAEMERQRDAAAQATEEHRKRLAAAEAAEQAAKDTLEQEISNYERTLSEKNRACAVTAADRDWLLQRH